MRIWMLAPLLYSVAAIDADRGGELSSTFFDRMIASSSRFDPFGAVQLAERATARECCNVRSRGSIPAASDREMNG